MKWLTSYLTDHKQQIESGKTYSHTQLLDFGVPQGSVLGPCCSLCTQPLSEVINQFNQFNPLKHCLYADDTQIHVSHTPKTANNHLQILQNCLLAVQEWMSKNMLKLNPEKNF